MLFQIIALNLLTKKKFITVNLKLQLLYTQTLMLNNFLSHFSSCVDSHDGMVNLFCNLETNFLNFALQGLVASLLYVARCGYHVMNLSLAHGLLHIYSSAPQKPYQPPSSPCFPCGTCRYHPALENNQLQYSIPAA